MLQVVARQACQGWRFPKREKTINQRKNLPIPAFRHSMNSMVVMCHGGDVTCFDVMRLVEMK